MGPKVWVAPLANVTRRPGVRPPSGHRLSLCTSVLGLWPGTYWYGAPARVQNPKTLARTSEQAAESVDSSERTRAS